MATQANQFDRSSFRDRALEEAVFPAIRQALQATRFGQILLTVHEGRLVQMDVTEKQRFPG